MMLTIGGARAEIFSRLKKAGVERADWETRQLICFGAELTPEQLVIGRGMYLPEEKTARLFELAERRAAGEPLAYILGYWEIFGLELVITPDVLVPREDTGVLIDVCRGKIPESGGRVLDLCCGSGCVGLALARASAGLAVTLADISPEALAVAKQNIKLNSIEGVAVCVAADALSPPSAHLGRFDVIACNPPYIPDSEWDSLDASVRGYEPHLALRGGADGLDFYRAVSLHWRSALRPGGTLAFEAGYNQAEVVYGIMSEHGYSGVDIFKDAQGYGRVVAGRVTQGESTPQ